MMCVHDEKDLALSGLTNDFLADRFPDLALGCRIWPFQGDGDPDRVAAGWKAAQVSRPGFARFRFSPDGAPFGTQGEALGNRCPSVPS